MKFQIKLSLGVDNGATVGHTGLRSAPRCRVKRSSSSDPAQREHTKRLETVNLIQEHDRQEEPVTKPCEVNIGDQEWLTKPVEVNMPTPLTKWDRKPSHLRVSNREPSSLSGCESRRYLLGGGERQRYDRCEAESPHRSLASGGLS